MFEEIKKNIAIQLGILILLAFFLSGCGKKAPPKPPRKEQPSAVKSSNSFLDHEKKRSEDI